MGGIINHAPCTPHWKRLYEAAILEVDSAKLLQRIAVAQSAILDQIEDGFSKPADGQQRVLRDAVTHAKHPAHDWGARHCRMEKCVTLKQSAAMNYGERLKTG
jgi:hypothetical protein